MKKIHYSYVICLCGILLISTNIGLCSNILSVYLPFIEEKGISGAQGSAILSVRCIFSFLSVFFANDYYSRLSLRRGCVIATAAGAAGFLTFFLGGSLASYYIGSALCGIAYGLGSNYPAALLIRNWFRQKSGMALGICQAGSGLSLVVFAPLVTSIVLRYDLKTAFLIQSLYMFFCSALMLLLIRGTPEEKGLQPFGAESGDAARTQALSGNSSAPDTLSRAMWIMTGIAVVLFGGAGVSFTGHLSVLVRTSGYSSQIAARMVSLFGLVLIPSKILFGTAADRIGSLKASVLFLLFNAAGCLSSVFLDGQTTVLCYLLAVLCAIGGPVFNMGSTFWAADLVSPSGYARALKWMQFFYTFGSILITPVPGMIADHTGEYVSSFCMLGGMSLFGILLIILVYRRRPHRQSR